MTLTMSLSMSNSILVVEDNDDILLLLKMVLESQGYKVETANNGKEALKSIEKDQPQLILMDIMMPETSGLQISRTIKEELDGKSIPILLVSAVDRLKDEQLSNSMADGIIYKPFDLDELVYRVDSLTSKPEAVYQV